MKINKVKIGTIVPYWRNARVNDGVIEALKKSIQEYGFNSPIVVDKDMTIINGHARYKALMELGYETVEVVVKDNLTDEQIRKYRIADNKLSEIATWDNTKLLEELRTFSTLDDMSSYFPYVDLDALIKDSVGQNVKPINYDDIETATENLANQFKESSEKTQKDYIEIKCPYCEQGMHFSKADILNKIDKGLNPNV